MIYILSISEGNSSLLARCKQEPTLAWWGQSSHCGKHAKNKLVFVGHYGRKNVYFLHAAFNLVLAYMWKTLKIRNKLKEKMVKICMYLKYFMYNSDLYGNIGGYPMRIYIDFWVQDYNCKYLYQKNHFSFKYFNSAIYRKVLGCNRPLVSGEVCFFD